MIFYFLSYSKFTIHFLKSGLIGCYSHRYDLLGTFFGSQILELVKLIYVYSALTDSSLPILAFNFNFNLIHFVPMDL